MIPQFNAFRLTKGVFIWSYLMAVKKTIVEIQKMKVAGEKIAMLTCYDYPTARILDGCGIDMILVGDSAGVVVAGYENTLPVTMDEMLYHTRAVMRALPKALVVTDMPFMSYQSDVVEARKNAGRMLKEGGAAAVKIEGGANMAPTIRALVEIDIPVVGHIGLTPQSIHRMGGYKVQGKKSDQAEQLIADALAIQEAGAFALVLEGIPQSLAQRITELLVIPTIGIGAGSFCDGQVLVLHDILGLCEKYSPKFVKRYAEAGIMVAAAVKEYMADVKSGSFPAAEHCFN
jgi:3-methyl-2-oxobutanoate hydroxymethyltransferase